MRQFETALAGSHRPFHMGRRLLNPISERGTGRNDDDAGLGNKPYSPVFIDVISNLHSLGDADAFIDDCPLDPSSVPDTDTRHKNRALYVRVPADAYLTGQ